MKSIHRSEATPVNNKITLLILISTSPVHRIWSAFHLIVLPAGPPVYSVAPLGLRLLSQLNSPISQLVGTSWGGSAKQDTLSDTDV